MNLNVGDTLGKYSVVEFLGAGVFGTVYLMRDNMLKRDVAVKFVENQDPTAFVAHFEAQLLHQCRSDRIVAVNSVDIVRDIAGRNYAAIDMEYIEDGSAQDLIEDGYVSIRRAVKISIDILFALEHAHIQKILHRDAKPANFMLQGTRAKLSDFGLATTAAASLTGSGAGSPVYCAPEVINDNLTNAQTDVFAVGMSLFQMSNNILNLAARVTSIDAIKTGRIVATIGYEDYVPRRIRNICNRACSPDPARRYATAAEMRQALERLRVKEDWQRVSPEYWRASINGQSHEILVEGEPSPNITYRINGRRRNANCYVADDLLDAVAAAERWVYNNTF